MNGPARRQRGVTLLISLIMLTVLTLFAAAMIRLSSTNMLIAGNMAIQHALRDSVQQAIETDINSAAFYNDAVNGTGCWSGSAKSNTYGSSGCFSGANTNGYTITLYKPVCLKYEPTQGGSALESATALNDTFWEVTATGVDTLSGASVSLTQGVKVTLPVGNCNGS